VNNGRTQIDRILWAAFELSAGKIITARDIGKRFAVSYATAKRDLVALERHLPVTVRERPVPGAIARKELRWLRPSGAKNAPSPALSGRS
jgi:hypothetical protein